MEAKALVMSLGLKTVTVYIPLYNLVKEIRWSSRVNFAAKETIKVEKYPGDSTDYFISKNDCIDVRI